VTSGDDLYKVVLRPAAQRDFDGLARDVQQRIVAALGKLSVEPRGAGLKKLAGGDDLYRKRVGDYRIIFQIDDATRTVRVAIIRHRKDAYR